MGGGPRWEACHRGSVLEGVQGDFWCPHVVVEAWRRDVGCRGVGSDACCRSSPDTTCWHPRLPCAPTALEHLSPLPWTTTWLVCADACRSEQLLELAGHHGEVWCCAVSSYGDFVITGAMQQLDKGASMQAGC